MIFSIALIRDHAVDDATYDAALKVLGEEQLLDLTGLIGEYMKVALLLAVGRVGIPATAEPLPPLR